MGQLSIAGGRPLGFFAELSAATIVITFALMWLPDAARQLPGRAYFNFTALTGWQTTLVTAAVQWAVMRRYVPWASQWAWATIAGLLVGPAMVAWLFTMRAGTASREEQIAIAVLGSALSRALLQYVVLRPRLKWAWPWIVVVPAIALLAQMMATWLVQFGPDSLVPLSRASQVLRATLRPAIDAVLTFGVLAWLCRDWLGLRAERPAGSKSTRSDFLIGWIAVHAFAYVGPVEVVAAATRNPVDQAEAFVIVFLATLGAGQTWALSTTKADIAAWRRATLAGLAGWTALIFLMFGLVYLPLLLSKWGGLGLGLGLAQWFAVRRWSWGLAWIAATLVGWTCPMWLPALGQLAVGAGEVWRLPINNPRVFGAIAGALTGAALVWDLGPDRFARPHELANVVSI